MPTPRRPHPTPARPLWQNWLEGGQLALWLGLTPLALLLPVLTALLAAWGLHSPHAETAPRYFAAPSVSALPELHAEVGAGVPGLLGDLPPPPARLAWLPRRYAAPMLRPAPLPVRPLAFGWLGRRQLEGG